MQEDLMFIQILSPLFRCRFQGRTGIEWKGTERECVYVCERGRERAREETAAKSIIHPIVKAACEIEVQISRP